MQLTITISKFEHKGVLEKLPELIFSHEDPDYWIMLPIFEEIEENKNGFLAEAKSSSSLAEAMRKFIALSPLQTLFSKS